MLSMSVVAGAGGAIAAERSNKATHLDSTPQKPGADGWYDARPIDDSFSVRMPAVFQAFTEEGKTEAGVATRTVGVRANAGAAFGGVTSYAASCVTQNGDTRPPKQRLQDVVGHWESRGMVSFRRPIESGSYPGVEFELADDVKVIRSRVYAPKLGTCTVLMSWRPFAKPSDADIDKFLDSFQFTRR